MALGSWFEACVRRGRGWHALVAALALAGGCGGGGSVTTVQQFVFQAMGPGGGVATAGPVRLTIPPGALGQDTGVAILPEASPLPIAAPDGCTYSYVGPIYCCGPVGQNLLVNGALRMAYQEALIPAGFTELDLVLLIWDNAASVMRPRAMPPATQDTAQNFFEDPAYAQLGHVAIGLRDCRNANPFDLLVQNGGNAAAKPGGAPAGDLASPGAALLYEVDSNDLLTPVLVPTFSLLFDGFVPSPDLQRVLLAPRDPSSGSPSVQTVRLDGTGAPILLAASDGLNGVFVQSGDPLYGWLQQGSAVHAYYTQYVQPSGQMLQGARGTLADPPQRYEVWRRIGDGTAPATRQHVIDASGAYLDDLRQSGVGAHLSASSYNFLGAAYFVDEVNVPAGTPASLAVVPPSDGPQPPRFLPGSEDVYVVTSNGQEVNRHTPAGAFVSTVFSLAVEPTFADRLVDFALAPDGEAFAAVVELDGEGTESQLWMGTLTAGVEATYSFFQQVSVNEMVWHPQQTGVFLDLGGFQVGLYRLLDSDGFFIDQTSLLTSGLSNVDVNRQDGRIVTLVDNRSLDAGGTAAVLPPGIYLWPPDASSSTPLSPPGVLDPRSVRWIATWRHAAGRFASRVR